ncbi:MAG: hypothetical protein RIS47_1819 [Bacteroidota bacterium]|jgi:CRP-like cAMP-binding protein
MSLKDIPTCKDCILHHRTVFSSLKDEELDMVDYEKTCSHYKRGSVIINEGNRASGFYCVTAGVVKLYKTGIDGKEQIIRFSKKGDIFGFRSILSEEPVCLSAKAIQDTTLCYIPAHILIEMVRQNSDFAMSLMQRTCKELGEANNYILDIAQKTVRERLAEVLLILMDSFEVDEDGVLQIALTREEIANIVGTATESVIRLLSEFKQDKLIEIRGRKIKLIDIKGLERVANNFS